MKTVGYGNQRLPGKSQVGIEFLTGVTILLIIYGVTLTVYNLNFRVPIVQNEKGKQVCYTISEGIDSAIIGGDGFAMNLSLPDMIDSQDYFVMITNNSLITIDWNKSEFACSVTSQSVEDMTFNPCRLSIINIGGIVYVGMVETDKKVYSFGEDITISGEYYYDPTVSVFYENNSYAGGENVPLPIETWDFTYIFGDDLPPGKYRIFVSDGLYKNLNAETWIDIV